MYPYRIVIEDLNVREMMRNKNLSRAIQEQCFYEFRRQLTYKCKWNNTKLIVADRFFPSSKTCSCCGNVKKDLKLSEYGIRPHDFPRILQNARDTMGGLFTLDPHPITDDEILNILEKSYR